MSVRARLVVAAVCAGALVAGGASLERIGPRAVGTGSPQEPISGAWSCPHGGGEGWRVWVTVANPGAEAVEVRMITSAGGAATPESATVIEHGTLRYFEIAAALPGSATVVEYLGGTVAAGSLAIAPEGGLSAEPCAGSPGAHWHIPEASTLRGETALLVVHNPFAAQAVVDVILTAGERQIRPGRLQGVVLGPLDARAFELNHFALGEEALGGEIVAPQGRVAAASVIVSPGGVRASLAVAAPATRWALPGAGAETDVVVRALTRLDAPVSGELQGENGATPAIDLETVVAGTAEAFSVKPAEGGFLVQADGPSPMVAGRRMALEAPAPAPPEEEKQKGGADRKGGGGKDRGGAAAGGGGKGRGDEKRGGGKKDGGKKEEEPPPEEPSADLAATAGAPAPSDRWLVLPAVGPGGGPSALLLQNVMDTEVEATVTLLGTTGSLGTPTTVTVPPRATVRVAIPGGTPAAALVEGEGLVAAQAGLSPAAFAVVLGVPI